MKLPLTNITNTTTDYSTSLFDPFRNPAVDRYIGKLFFLPSPLKNHGDHLESSYGIISPNLLGRCKHIRKKTNLGNHHPVTQLRYLIASSVDDIDPREYTKMVQESGEKPPGMYETL